MADGDSLIKSPISMPAPGAGAVAGLASLGGRALAAAVHLAGSVSLALFPGLCTLCGAPEAGRPATGLCRLCLALLPDRGGEACPRCDQAWQGGDCPACRRAPPVWRRLRAPFAYTGPIRQLIATCKFGRQPAVGTGLGALLAGCPEVVALAAGVDAVVPVPMPTWRRLRRGFNLSTLLARAVAARCRLPLLRPLVRHGGGPPQSRLHGAARRAGVAGAFRASRPVAGALLLVDDVITSGHTAAAASRALLAAGAGEVRVVALAATERH